VASLVYGLARREKTVKDLSIIIVNWNSKDILQGCLRSIYSLTSRIEYEVIVIDSGSFDGADDLIEREFPRVVFLQSEKNVGFARANNVAYQCARGQKILFLNPDTELVNPAIEIMYGFLNSCTDAGAVGGKLLNGDDSLQTSCVQSFPSLLNQALSADFLRDLFPRSQLWGMAALYTQDTMPSPVNVISGACLMLTREAFERVDRFSEDYFMYAEDIDICHKLKEAGYSNYFIPRAVVRHFGGGSTANAPSEFSLIMTRESIWQFFRKSRGTAYAQAYRLTTIFVAVGRLTVLIVLLPFSWFRGRVGQHLGSIGKWVSILKWATKVKNPYIPA